MQLNTFQRFYIHSFEVKSTCTMCTQWVLKAIEAYFLPVPLDVLNSSER